MWVFLVTEILFFGGMFCCYTVYRALYPSAFGHASNHLDIMLGAVSTAVSTCSRFAMARAADSGGTRRQEGLGGFLGVSLLSAPEVPVVRMSSWDLRSQQSLIPGFDF